MNLLCRGMADWCKRNGAVSEEDYPIILYGIQVCLNTSLKVLGIFLVGILLHRFAAVLISMAVFCSMRYWTGGWHSKSHLGCFGTMLIPCVCPALLTGLTGIAGEGFPWERIPWERIPWERIPMEWISGQWLSWEFVPWQWISGERISWEFVPWKWFPLVCGCMLIYSLYKILRYAPCNSEVNPIEDAGILRAKRIGGIAELAALSMAVLFLPGRELQFLVLIPLCVDAFLLRKG